MSKTVFALLVAIDEYGEELPEISGCVPDAEEMDKFLEAYCRREGYGYEPKRIYNGNARRDNIIQGFSHLRATRDGDVGIFFFAGHGSQFSAPAEFRALDGDNMLQTIVCADSRPAGRDLVDKELAYLLWEAQANKQVHLLVIMDCCHAGNNTRGDHDPVKSPENYPDRTRAVKVPPNSLDVKHFLGYKHYQRTADGILVPPSARYVQLSACESYQKAQEVFSGDRYGGIFSRFLLKALEDEGQELTYRELIRQVGAQIRMQFRKQQPVLWAYPEADEDLIFLGGCSRQKRDYYHVVHTKYRDWTVDGGKLDGFCGRGDHQPTQLTLQDDPGRIITVERVGLNVSTVSGMEECYTRKAHRAVITNDGRPSVKLAFHPDTGQGVKDVLTFQQERLEQLRLKLVEDVSDADYLIHGDRGQLYLTGIFGKDPLFKRIKGYGPEEISDFIEKIGVVRNWQHVVSLKKRSEFAIEKDLEFTFYYLPALGPDDDQQPASILEAENGIYNLPYIWEKGQWLTPAFRLHIRNRSREYVCLSALLCGYNFSVTNKLLEKVWLAPQEETWLWQQVEDRRYQTIGLELHPAYRGAGIMQASVQLRIIVGTGNINTSGLNRKGLLFDGDAVESRRSSLDPDPELYQDWGVIHGEINLFHPLAACPLSGKAAFPYAPLEITGSGGNTAASVRLSTMQAHQLAVQEELVLLLEDGTRCDPISFLNRWPQPEGLHVIEILVDEEEGDPQKVLPISLQLPENEPFTVEPVWYDPALRRFRLLAHHWENGQLRIRELPPQSPTYPNDGRSSYKILLHKMDE